MSDPNSNSAPSPETKRWLGKTVTGVVTYVNPERLGLFVQELPVSTAARMHVSQASDEYVNTLVGMFSVGQVLPVMVLWFRPHWHEWEVSRRALHRQTRWHSVFPKGTRASGVIERIGDYGALVSLGTGFVGRILPGYCDFLDRASLLIRGQTLEVEVYQWDYSGDGPLLIPVPTHEVNGVIQAIRSYATKRHALRQYLDVAVHGLGIVSCDVARLSAIEERYHIGDEIKLLIEIHPRTFFPHYVGKVIIPEKEANTYRRIPELGSVIDAKVHTVKDFGAFCVVADYQDALLHRTKVIKDTVPEMNRYLSPGDIIRVRVVPPSDRDRQDFGVEFISVVRQSTAGTPDDRTRLFALTGEKQKQVTGGLKRAPDFRKAVLETYNHTCLICGEDLRVTPDVSAAQAAHIVPHADRGADSIDNAICLCPLCHWAFDRGLLAISDHAEVLVSRILLSESPLAQRFTHLARRRANFPTSLPKSPLEALRWHMRNVFLDSAGMQDP